jgi:hypothetical protein
VGALSGSAVDAADVNADLTDDAARQWLLVGHPVSPTRSKMRPDVAFPQEDDERLSLAARSLRLLHTFGSDSLIDLMTCSGRRSR